MKTACDLVKDLREALYNCPMVSHRAYRCLDLLHGRAIRMEQHLFFRRDQVESAKELVRSLLSATDETVNDESGGTALEKILEVLEMANNSTMTESTLQLEMFPDA